MISSSSSTAVVPSTPSARPASSRPEISLGRTWVTAKATWTPCSSRRSSTMLPPSTARRSRFSGGSSIPGRTVSRMIATGSPSARIVRTTVSTGVSGSIPNASPASAPARSAPISRSRTLSATPRRSASSEYGRSTSRPSWKAVGRIAWPTYVPDPWRRVISPPSSSRSSAVRSVPRETPSIAASSSSGGRRSPGRWVPPASHARSDDSVSSTNEDRCGGTSIPAIIPRARTARPSSRRRRCRRSARPASCPGPASA